ncbi:MAG: hypothetical protein AAF682_31400 [Planctomycetota bacterium]
MRRILTAIAASLFCLSLVSFQSTKCTKADGCTSTTVASLYTGSPTIPCPAEDEVVELTTTATCKKFAASVQLLRCGSSDAPFFVVTGTTLHRFELKTSFTWGDVLNGNCAALIYTTFS